MLALQVSPPSLGPPFAVLPFLVLVAVVVGAVGTAIVKRLPNPVGKFRLLYVVILLPMTLLGYLLLTSLGLGPAIVASLPVDVTIVNTTLANFVEFLAAGIVWLAAYTPTIRGVRDVRDIDLPTRRALRNMVRYVIGLSVVLAAVITPLQVVPLTESLFTIGIGLAGITLVILYASPWLLPILRSTTRPEGATADRVETLRTRAGLDVRDVLVLDTTDEETATTLVRGLPGYRRLFVANTFLDRFDDSTAAALVAVETGKIGKRVFEIRVGTVLIAGVALLASVAGVGSRWATLGLSVLVLLGGFWFSRRSVLAADDYAAERLGADAVADALEQYASVHAMEPTRRRLPNPLSVNVPLGDRIDRLREQPNDQRDRTT